MRGAVSETPSPSVTPSRSLFIGGVGVLVLSVPFFIFGLAFLDVKGRVELECGPGGPCTLTRVGYLTRQVSGVFPLEELQGARVDRSRETRGEQKNIFRPVLLTTRGEFPISAHWMDTEREAQRVVAAVQRYLAAQGTPGISMWHDDRSRASRLGMLFTGASVLVLFLGLFLTTRAFRRRGEERARAATVP